MADVTGKPRVIDGDTIHIGKTKIRLHGIDAPEMKQTCKTSKGKEQMCGVLAKQALERLVRGQDVTCKGDTRDQNPAIGPDSYTGYLVSTFQGSTETTFYVLAVYFGAVGIRRIRHALVAALAADVAGIAGAVAIVSYLYGA